MPPEVVAAVYAVCAQTICAARHTLQSVHRQDFPDSEKQRCLRFAEVGGYEALVESLDCDNSQVRIEAVIALRYSLGKKGAKQYKILRSISDARAKLQMVVEHLDYGIVRDMAKSLVKDL